MICVVIYVTKMYDFFFFPFFSPNCDFLTDSLRAKKQTPPDLPCSHNKNSSRIKVRNGTIDDLQLSIT